MKISELIKKLEELKEDHGDLETRVLNEWGYDNIDYLEIEKDFEKDADVLLIY